MNLLLVVWEFAKVGLFAVGGGLATLPFIIEMSSKTGWFTMADISTMVGISESTPGPLGINMASYVGFIMHGPLGAISTVIGIITPSIIVIILVARALARFKSSKLVKHMFEGLRPASAALITVAAISIFKLCVITGDEPLNLGAQLLSRINIPVLIFGTALFAFRKKVEKHPIYSIAVSACVGIIYGAVVTFVL